MKERMIFTFIATTFLMGCAATFHVNVDSINAPGAEAKKKYTLLSGLKDIETTDLQFKEYTKYVDKALASKGFLRADGFQDANIAIFLVYGIGDPQKHPYSFSLPVWGETGVSSSSTIGGITTYTPSYGVTGYTTYTGTQTTYFRFLILEAVDLDEYRQTQRVAQIWKTTVTSTGTSSDLRTVFPILVGASKPYIGTNTGKKVEIKLTENDRRVIEIKESTSAK